jgi:hypothetical protein
MVIIAETEYVRYAVGPDGANLHFTDKRTGKDYCASAPASPLARIKKEGETFAATAVSAADGEITIRFGESGASAVLRATAARSYFALEVKSVSDETIDEFEFVDIPLTLKGSLDEPFGGCALALNLQTNVAELPGPNSRLRAICYRRFGFAGAKVAIIGCPTAHLRHAMQEAVGEAEDLPRSSIGGPWALDAPANRGSYLFNFGNVTEATVDKWIELCQALGFTQLDFHMGSSLRFGDLEPNREMYPRGLTSLRAVIDRLHAAGIQAGLHTYSFFMAKNSRWVTPVPDARLAKDATFALAQSLSTEATTVPVLESTQGMSTITGFFVRNSVTLQIDDELITYGGVSKEPPYAFTGCQRGACGTRVAPHAKGANVHHLKECFGLFVPDGDSTLFTEVAARTAEVFNECGFDMIYLDALDGEDIIAGGENAWHYGSKFTFEICKRLKRPALMEMSTFHHHLWFVRSRMGAWDHPTRSAKRFVDLHVKANDDANRRMFLPGQLGWWAIKTWSGAQGEPTFADDLEYLCSKCLGADTGFALMGIDPDSFAARPAMRRWADIIQRYERLRLSNSVPQAIKERLRQPGEEFTLEQRPDGKLCFRPVRYAKHKVEAIDGERNVWQVRNEFGAQPLQLRIEALMSAAPYDDAEGVVIADFDDAGVFTERSAASEVTADLQPSAERVRIGGPSGRFSAGSTRAQGEGAWAQVGRVFSPPLDLDDTQALGLWVYGDGRGELLNVQLRSPEHISGGIGDHYIPVNFTGWRYFELIEPEGERYAEYEWPYGGIYSIYRESVDFGRVGSLSLWFNDLPSGEAVACYLSPIKALPLVEATLINPSLTIGGRTITFPVEIGSGCYLEFRSMSDCKLYNREGELVREVQPQGEAPTLAPGENEVLLGAEVAPAGVNARAYVTVISQGEPLE